MATNFFLLGMISVLTLAPIGANAFLRHKRCGGCGEGNSGYGGGGNNGGYGTRRSESSSYNAGGGGGIGGGLSLRDLLQVLPLLSNLNAAGPVGSSAITHLLTPPVLPPPPPPPAPSSAFPIDSLGAIAQLAKIISKRQTTNETDKEFVKEMSTAEQDIANQTASNMAASGTGGGSPVASEGQRGHATKGQGPVGQRGNNTAGDAYEFEDYGPPPPPSQLSQYKPKGRLGSICQVDNECVTGAICQPNGPGEKECACRAPFVKYEDRCVPSAPTGL